MKKANRKWMAAIMGVMAAVFFAGCGKSGQEGASDKEFVYVPTYLEMDMKGKEIQQIEAKGDMLYMEGSSWDEDTGEETAYFYKYDVQNETVEELVLNLSPDENTRVYVSNFAMGSDENPFLAVNVFSIEDDESTWEIWKMDGKSGSILETIDLSTVLAGSANYIMYMCADDQGNLYIVDGESNIVVLDSTGKKLFDLSVGSWINSIHVSGEGTVYISYYSESDVEYKSIDLAKKALGDSLAGAEGFNTAVYPASTKSFLVCVGDAVSLLDAATGTSEELFKWLDADINSDIIMEAGELSDGRIWVVTRDMGEAPDYEDQLELILLTRTRASETVQKEEITYGALWADSGIKKAIINFNKTNEQYRITVKEYIVDDYQAGLTQFNAELTSGNCPDIVDLSSIDFEMYATKGVLEDLTPYMKESGLTGDKYVENILNAYSVDDKVYGLTPQFYVGTVIMKKSLAGDMTGWNLKETLDFMESYDPKSLFTYGTRQGMLYFSVLNNLGEFVDWESGECSFGSEEFVRILELASKFPGDEEINYNDEEMQNFSKRIHNDELILMETSISSVQEYQMMRGMFGEDVTFIGYPDEDRTGNKIFPTGGSMGIASKSKHKDAAWEFVQSMFTEEYQMSSNINWGFPVYKEALEAQFEKDMEKEYYKDENGNQVEMEKTTWGYGDFEMVIYAATQEEVDTVRDLLGTAKSLYGTNNEQITQIITEETEPFFQGQKTAQEVADIIDNRVRIYVNENR